MCVCVSECATACMHTSGVKLGVSSHRHLFEAGFLVHCCVHEASCPEASRDSTVSTPILLRECVEITDVHYCVLLCLEDLNSGPHTYWGKHCTHWATAPAPNSVLVSDNAYTTLVPSCIRVNTISREWKAVYRVAESICKLCKRLICTIWRMTIQQQKHPVYKQITYLYWYLFTKCAWLATVHMEDVQRH